MNNSLLEMIILNVEPIKIVLQKVEKVVVIYRSCYIKLQDSKRFVIVVISMFKLVKLRVVLIRIFKNLIIKVSAQEN